MNSTDSPAFSSISSLTRPDHHPFSTQSLIFFDFIANAQEEISIVDKVKSIYQNTQKVDLKKIGVDSNYKFDQRPALVIGVWTPGSPEYGIVTVSEDPHSNCFSSILNKVEPKYQPDFPNDFMEISNHLLGPNKYKRVIFEGCCPVSTSMGARPCKSYQSYKKIDPIDLAEKINELISKDGGWVFFRHCTEAADPDGIIDPEKREKFISVFERHGFKKVKEFHPPYLLTQSHPGSDIPDPSLRQKHKWNPANGSIIFFKPSE